MNETIDLKLTLIDSGQCFLFDAVEGGFRGATHGKAVRFSQENGVLRCEGLSIAEMRRYLDLDRDYAALRAEAERFAPVARAMDALPGLRVMNQPTWEALICFILSANNNIPRIRKLVRALSQALGREVGEGLYALPEPEVLAASGEEALRSLGVGYRALYLLETARTVSEGFPLNELSGMPYEAAHEALLALKGVGDKVADCVLLFGAGHAEAFPVDVWVERAMAEQFSLTANNRVALSQRSRALLGENAGLMQQFLFHHQRTVQS